MQRRRAGWRQTRRGGGRPVAETKVDVLVPAFPHLGKGCVHTSARDAAAVSDDEAATTPLDKLGQGFVIDDLILDAQMAANRVVHIAADQDELTIGDGITEARIVHAPGRKADREGGKHDGHEDLLPERAGHLASQDGEQDDLGLDGFRVARGQCVRGENPVGVYDTEPITPSQACGLIEGERLAGPAGREGRPVHDVEAGEIRAKSSNDPSGRIG